MFLKMLESHEMAFREKLGRTGASRAEPHAVALLLNQSATPGEIEFSVARHDSRGLLAECVFCSKWADMGGIIEADEARLAHPPKAAAVPASVTNGQTEGAS
ncbi:MAG: hypothetical protein GY947_10690 [Rhodobacteraceae bacterium]|nr:hypothetical protein [Paracoccaceae bacterium]